MSLVTDLIDTYRNDPFYSPKKFVLEHDCSPADFASAISYVKQYKIDLVTSGAYSQYWTSIKKAWEDNLSSAIDNIPKYPARLGLYPGVSCMFNCQFCGKREGTEFSKDLADTSLDMFNNLLEQHVQVSNHQKIIRLSGGLEPTTNKHIAKIVKMVDGYRLRPQMYTNGFLMTDKWLAKNDDIMCLDSIRFSVYGYDYTSYKNITEHSSGVRALDNIKNFIKHLDFYQIPMTVGLNYVILTGKLDEFDHFIDYVKSINTSTGGLDWISLREDSSQNLWGLTEQERRQIASQFERLESICRFAGTKIDFGYSLAPLRHNESIGTVRHATQMLPKAFPQVSVIVDVAGNVYPYHDVFPNRPGQDQYCLGNVKEKDLETIITNWCSHGTTTPQPDDLKFMDTSDHMITLLVQQGQELRELGIVEWLL